MTIRIGLLGCGKIARLHIAGFKAAPDLCKVVVVCDEYSEELARSTALIHSSCTLADHCA